MTILLDLTVISNWGFWYILQVSWATRSCVKLTVTEPEQLQVGDRCSNGGPSGQWTQIVSIDSCCEWAARVVCYVCSGSCYHSTVNQNHHEYKQIITTDLEIWMWSCLCSWFTLCIRFGIHDIQVSNFKTKTIIINYLFPKDYEQSHVGLDLIRNIDTVFNLFVKFLTMFWGHQYNLKQFSSLNLIVVNKWSLVEFDQLIANLDENEGGAITYWTQWEANNFQSGGRGQILEVKNWALLMPLVLIKTS